MTLQEVEDKLEELMPEIGKSFASSNLNKNELNTYWIDVTEEGINKFNEIYSLVKDWRVAPITKSGAINKTGKSFRYFSHRVFQTKSSIELIIIAPRRSYRVMFRSGYGKEEGKLSGKVAFKKFIAPLEKRGYDLLAYGIENGEEVKRTIPKYDRRVNSELRYKTIEHAFHFDINSAFFAGIANSYGYLFDGFFGEHIRDIFNNRKNPDKKYKHNKDILTHTQGYFQSEYCKHNGYKYCLAHMAKAGIVYTCQKLLEIIQKYEEFGCEFIATNTDGAWMTIPPEFSRKQAESVEGYGKELGDFKIDYWDCKLRYKSANAYEFIDDGKVIVKYSGICKLDKIKPREEWEWGDIFRKDASPIRPIFIIGEGIIDEKDL